MSNHLYHAPMACSLASRLALVEAGVPHDIHFVLTWKGENKTAEYLAINPRGKVPALKTAQGVLTESSAILPYIADLVPDKRLIPLAGSFERAVAQSRLSFFSSSVHAAFTPLIGAHALTEAAARDAALGQLLTVLGEADAMLEGRDHVLDHFSVCDLYLFVFLLWRRAPALAGLLRVFANLDRLEQAILARPGVAAIIGEEMKLRFAE